MVKRHKTYDKGTGHEYVAQEREDKPMTNQAYEGPNTREADLQRLVDANNVIEEKHPTIDPGMFSKKSDDLNLEDCNSQVTLPHFTETLCNGYGEVAEVLQVPGHKAGAIFGDDGPLSFIFDEPEDTVSCLQLAVHLQGLCKQETSLYNAYEESKAEKGDGSVVTAVLLDAYDAMQNKRIAVECTLENIRVPVPTGMKISDMPSNIHFEVNNIEEEKHNEW